MTATTQFWLSQRICWSEQTIFLCEDTSLDAIQEAIRHTGDDCVMQLQSEVELEQRIENQSESWRLTGEMIGDSDQATLDAVARQVANDISIVSQADDGPIIKLLNNIFAEAIRVQASDIHIESQLPISVVRFRVDGLLTQAAEVSLPVAERVISRIKVLAKLNIAERRIPQDGRMTVTLGSRVVDLRISTIPSVDGERVVLRLLESKSSAKSITSLGLAPSQEHRLRQLVNKPNGMILATGPTGSGKTTTLYAALQAVDAGTKNIMTIEDPVEYRLPGVSQTPINHQQSMTFATGLRAILRQDPDVVLVGEVRDSETASIATQASLTGHMVLSTLHANEAAGCVTRLRDLGIESYIIASAVRGILAQRLLRKVCSNCVKARPISDAERVAFQGVDGLPLPHEMAEPKGCDQCNQTGYAGRYGVFEILEITEAIRLLIQQNAEESELQHAFLAQGEPLMKQALKAVCQGVTTFDEVMRTLGDC